MDEKTRKQLESLQADMEKRQEIADMLQKKDPTLPDITAIIMAGDYLGMERADAILASGESFDNAMVVIGSYFRLEWVVQQWQKGNVDIAHVFELLPDLWRGSDPDDTDPRFLSLWKKAWRANGSRYIRDGKPLPRNKWLDVYRGQDDNDHYGIAWTLNPQIAAKFARGAALRASNRNGVVIRGKVRREMILAYLTGRGESEVIVDPINVYAP